MAKDLGTGAVLALVLAAVMGGPTLAGEKYEVAPPTGLDAGSPEHFAFDAADTDGDGQVSEAEMARDAAAGFSGLDTDRSGALTPAELGPHDPAAFARVDRNGDGQLTYEEVMTFKSNAFRRADADADGHLSFQEMYNEVEAESRGAN